MSPTATSSSRLWIRLLGGFYGLLLLAGFAMGLQFGAPSSTVARPKLAAKTRTANTVATANTTSPERIDPSPAPTPKLPELAKKEPTPKVVEPPPKEVEPKSEPKAPPKPEPKPMPPTKGTAVTFEPKVQMVFKSKCVVCHGGANAKGGLDLRSLAAAIKGGDSGAAIKPGDPDDSLLWQSLSEGTMPPKGKEKPTADELKLIREWIAGGAK
jgi:periplasmic protein TonB